MDEFKLHIKIITFFWEAYSHSADQYISPRFIKREASLHIHNSSYIGVRCNIFISVFNIAWVFPYKIHKINWIFYLDSISWKWNIQDVHEMLCQTSEASSPTPNWGKFSCQYMSVNSFRGKVNSVSNSVLHVCLCGPLRTPVVFIFNWKWMDSSSRHTWSLLNYPQSPRNLWKMRWSNISKLALIQAENILSICWELWLLQQ